FDHASVLQADLHPVRRAVVAGLGLDDGPAARVLERGRGGLLQCRAGEWSVVAPSGDGYPSAPTEEGDGQRAAPDPPGLSIHGSLLPSQSRAILRAFVGGPPAGERKVSRGGEASIGDAKPDRRPAVRSVCG